MKKIILIGYMGSGKSTVGKLLSKSLDYTFLDLDKLIENEQKLTINEIFEKHGEIYFRKLEHEILKKMLKTEDNCIISLGGGTPCYANNMQLLKEYNAESVYLNCSIDELFERLSNNRSKRPLIAKMSDSELKEFIAIHLFERSYFYNQADIKIKTNRKTKLELVDEIRKNLF